MEEISISWEPVLVNVKETLHVLFWLLPTLALGENTEAGMESEASRLLPVVLLLKFSELIEVEVESPASETVLTVTESREVPVRLNVVVHSTAAWEAAKSQGRNDYQCFLHNWGRLNGVNLFRLADYKSEK